MKKHIYLWCIVLFSFLSMNAQVYPTWTQTNLIAFPRNVAGQPTGIGRVSHMAFHPTDSQTLFAVSASGGVWKTTSSGRAWVSLNLDTLPVQSLACILINPKNPQVMLVGSGDADYYGGGYSIYKTTDGGASWKNITSGLGNRLVRRMTYCPWDTNIIIAATNDGIYKSINSGNNWAKRSNTDQMREVAWKTGNKSRVVYAVSNTKYWRSTDNGDTWIDMTSAAGVVPADDPTAKITSMCIAASPADSNYVYILSCDNSATNRTFNGLFRSTDGGTTFTRRSEASNPPSAAAPNILGYDNSNGASTGSQGGYNLTLICHPAQKDIIYTGSQNCWRSTDGGASWKLRSCWGCGGTNGLHADHHEFLFSPFQSNPWRLYLAHDGGVSRTLTNSDSIWEACSDGLSATEYYKMGQSTGYKELLLGGTQDNGLQYYFNKENLTIQGGDVTDDFVYDPLLSYSSYRNRNRNSYETGTQYNNNFTYRTLLGASLPTGQWIPDRTDTNCGFLMANYVLLRSTNFRAATNQVLWDSISKNLNNSGNATFVAGYENHINTNIIYLIRSDNTLIKVSNVRSANPGFSSTGLPFSTASNVSMDMHASRDSVLFISSGNQVYRYSINSGYAKNITYNLPAQTIWKVLVHKRPNNESLYLITQYGIYYKNQTQTTWQDFSEGLPSICRITDAEIFDDGSSESVIRVSLFGRGIWQSELVSTIRANPKAGFNTYKTYQMVGGQSGVYNLCDQTLLLQDQSTGSPSQRVYSITPGTGWQWINGTGPSDRNPQLVFTGEGDFNIKQIVSRGSLSDTATKSMTMASVKKAAACNPTTTNDPAPYGMGISGFSFGTIQSNSSLSNGTSPNVQDFSCSRFTTLQGGYAYPFSLTLGAAYSQYAKIYIDYNNNGIFDTATEKVFSSQTAGTNFSGNISLPAIPQVTDTFIRLRIMSDYLSNQMKDPCANMQYGAVEDYGIRIKKWPLPGCTGNFNIKDGDTINPNTTSKLSWDSSAMATGYDIYFDSIMPPQKVDSTTGLSYNLTNLKAGKTYYYQILPKNIAGKTLGCSIRKFTVKDTLRTGNLYISDTLICSNTAAIIYISGSRGSRQWQQLTTSGWTNISVPGDTLLTNQSGRYRVLVNDPPWGSGATNSVLLQVLNGTPGLWTGFKNYQWNDCKNWANGAVPDSSVDVHIPSGKRVIMSQKAFCKNFKADSNTLIDHQGNSLEVFGSYTSKGVIYQGNVSLNRSGGFFDASDTLDRIRLNNSGTISLSSPLYIKNIISLNQGVLNIQDHDLVMLDGAGWSGGHANSYIRTERIGAIQWTSVTGSQIIPLGDLSYTPAIFNQIPAGKTMRVRTRNNADFSGISLIDSSAYAKQTLYITCEDTTSTGTIQMTYDSSITGSLFKSDFCSGRYAKSNFTVQYPPVNTSLSRRITFDGIKLNNTLWIGSDQFPPHTKIVSLNTLMSGSDVRLDWQTSYEFMNKSFYILRGTDSLQLSIIDSVMGKLAYIATPSNYMYIDSNPWPMSPQFWYQVLAKDTSNASVFSVKKEIITGIGITEITDEGIQVWPNPFKEEVNISSSRQKFGNIRIMDASGREIRRFGGHQVSTMKIATSELASGIYILEIDTHRIKIVKP